MSGSFGLGPGEQRRGTEEGQAEVNGSFQSDEKLLKLTTATVAQL